MEADWDKTKENIRPLRQGRLSTATTFAEIMDPKASESLKVARAGFEASLKDNLGEDPLAAWVAYINWVEASYPKGGAESGLNDLVKKCCQKFYQEGKDTHKKYFDDERFVRIWIKLASFVPPVKTYDLMMRHGIGITYPDLYLNWAAEFESLKNITGAERILDKGIAACAAAPNDLARLTAAKKALLDRDCRAFLETGTLNGAAEENHEDEREMLGGLRPVGKDKKVAPINRTGSSKIHHRKGAVEQRSAKATESNKVTKVPVFNGESAFPVHENEELPPSDLASLFPSDQETLIQPMKVTKRALGESATARRSLSVHSSTFQVQVLSSDVGFQVMADPQGTPEQTTQIDGPGTNRPQLISVPRLAPARFGAESSTIAAKRVEETDWGFVDYRDPSPPGNQLALSTSFLSQGEPAALPQKEQMFMWDYYRFPSGCNEVSIEEGRAGMVKKRRERDAISALNQRNQTLEDKERIVEEKLVLVEQKLLAAEELRLAAETARNSAVEEQHIIDEVKRIAQEDLQFTGELCNGIKYCLLSLARDVSEEHANLGVCLLSFTKNILQSLNAINNNGFQKPRNLPFDLDSLLQVTAQLAVNLQEQRLWMVSCQSAPVVSSGNDISKSVAIHEENGNNPDNIALSQGASWQSSQPLSTSEAQATNPQINAMWNQTLNVTAKSDKIQIDEPVKFTIAPDEEPQQEKVPNISPEFPESLSLPIRQSLAPRKSTWHPTCLHTSAAADPENLIRTPLVPANKTGFQIFQDNSVSVGTPPEDSDDEQVVDSAEEKPFHVETVSIENDIPSFPIRESAAETNDEDVVADVDPAVFAEVLVETPLPLPIRTARYSAYSRCSVGFSDANDEFNYTSRKSVGFGDQSMQLGTETQFFSDIDFAKRMASTPNPKMTGAVYEDPDDDDEGMPAPFEKTRGGPRPSYYGLSPIMEGSRENKTSSSSGSSGFTTHLRSKKSIQTCSPLEEEHSDENHPVDPYNFDMMTEFKEQLQDRFRDDSLVENVAEDFVTKAIVGKTCFKLDGLRFNVEEVLGSGNYATVYLARCRTDAAASFAVKAQPTNGWWDHYIHSETLRRLRKLDDSERFTRYIVPLERFQRLSDGGSYTFMQCFEQGTIVSLVNAFQKGGAFTAQERCVPEPLAIKLSIDVLRAVEAIHSVNIIHGDIKADNFLLHSLRDLTNAKTPEKFLSAPAVVMTDFGCGIDLNLYEPNVVFSTVKKGKSTAGYEILNQHPWTFQIDYFGLLDVMHTLLFGEYMKVYEAAGRWKITKSFKRHWSEIWESTFSRLLNVAPGDQMPNLSEIRSEFEDTALRRLQLADITDLSRKIRVNVFMQRKSCFIGK